MRNWETSMTKNHVLLTSLRVRIPLRALWRGDIMAVSWPGRPVGPCIRIGGSSPLHVADFSSSNSRQVSFGLSQAARILQVWLNWQKHTPAKGGSGNRCVGSRPTACARIKNRRKGSGIKTGSVKTFRTDTDMRYDKGRSQQSNASALDSGSSKKSVLIWNVALTANIKICL